MLGFLRAFGALFGKFLLAQLLERLAAVVVSAAGLCVGVVEVFSADDPQPTMSAAATGATIPYLLPIGWIVPLLWSRSLRELLRPRTLP